MTKKFRERARNKAESGQAMLFTLLALGIFLIGAIAFAIDLSDLWFNRQSAQTAADAACTAGVEDLLADTVNGGTHGGFTPGTAFDCNSNSGYAPCAYAALNGYGSSVAHGSTVLGDNIYVDFPTAAQAPPGIVAPPAALASTPFIRVTATNNIPTFFAGMLQGMTQQSIKAIAVCGLQADQSPIPIIVLHPTLKSSLSIQGGGGTAANIGIIGGPSQSIQVNSCSSTGGSTPCGTNDAANIAGSGNVNLCQAGPGFCGADMGVFGAEPNPGTSAFTTSCGGNALCKATQRTPHWNSPEPPISDPFAQTAAPADPNTGGTVTPFVPSDLCGPVACAATPALINSADSTGKADCTAAIIAAGNCYVDYQVHGCPDSTAPAFGSGTAPSSKSGCNLYTPGHYANGIDVKNVVAVFDAGLYWLDTNGGTCSSTKGYTLCLEANSFVRPSFYKGTYTASVPNWFGYNDGTSWDGGTIFYFHGTGSVVVDSNSGKTTGGGTTPDDFGNNAWQFAGAKATVLAACPNKGTKATPALPDSIGGNILLAPCSLSGTWADPGTGTGPYTTPFATDRGILFFQDRGNAATSGKNSVQASWGGGGQFLLAGTMYFHQCVIGAADTGTGCDPSAFNVQFTLGGGSGSTTYVLGEIIADQLVLGGGGVISMHLSPVTTFNILKASLLQ